MKVRYKDKRGRWTNESNPEAVIWGVQESGKFKKVATEKGFDGDVFRNKGKTPEFRYKDSKGRFISKEAAEAIKESPVFKKQEKERLKEIVNRENLVEGDGQIVSFYDVVKTFKGSFIDLFGFNSLVITNKEGLVGRYTNKDKALLALAFEGRRGAKIAAEANKGKAKGKGRGKGKKRKSNTPSGVFEISIKMLEDGEYFIHFPY